MGRTVSAVSRIRVAQNVIIIHPLPRKATVRNTPFSGRKMIQKIRHLLFFGKRHLNHLPLTLPLAIITSTFVLVWIVFEICINGSVIPR